jgi:glyoxylase-like metal-dependent hydrolase (beta-lactamase superfamily II)/ferredoxin
LATYAERVPENVEGEFFVDSTCIDCDTCRQLAPEVFADAGEYSYVRAQPSRAEEERSALHALLACPTGSIGTVDRNRAAEAKRDFPLKLDEGLYYAGFTSANSFGASSYYLQTPDGNWLIDSPRYVSGLADRIEELGGVDRIFLTHRDDIADARKYARRFGAGRVIHRLELAAQPDAETVIDGDEPVALARELIAIPTPGHTQGHTVLLYGNRYLFSGDHLWWSRPLGRLNASRRVCWYSWSRQKESLRRLFDYRFEWVLPGHGERAHMPADEMRRAMRKMLDKL